MVATLRQKEYTGYKEEFIFLYFTLHHGTKNDGGLLVRRIPVQQQDGVIDYDLFNYIYHASHGNSVAALKLDQQQLRQYLLCKAVAISPQTTSKR